MIFAKEKAKEAPKEDIFDKIELDIFDTIEDTRLKKYVPPPKVSLTLSDEIKALIQAEIAAKISATVAEKIKDIKPRTIETKVVEKIIEKVLPTEKVIIKEKLDEAALQRTIDAKIKKAADEALFVPAPPILPNYSDQPDKYLYSDGKRVYWKTVASGSVDPAADITLTGAGVGLVVTTPDGAHTYRIGISNDGVLTTEQVS